MRQHRVARQKPSTSMVAALFVVTACLLVLGINGWRSMSARQQRLAETKASASNLARAASQHANDTLRVADTALISIVQQVESDGLATGRSQSMHQHLMRLTRKSPCWTSLRSWTTRGAGWSIPSNSCVTI